MSAEHAVVHDAFNEFYNETFYMFPEHELRSNLNHPDSKQYIKARAALSQTLQNAGLINASDASNPNEDVWTPCFSLLVHVVRDMPHVCQEKAEYKQTLAGLLMSAEGCDQHTDPLCRSIVTDPISLEHLQFTWAAQANRLLVDDPDLSFTYEELQMLRVQPNTPCVIAIGLGSLEWQYQVHRLPADATIYAWNYDASFGYAPHSSNTPMPNTTLHRGHINNMTIYESRRGYKTCESVAAIRRISMVTNPSEIIVLCGVDGEFCRGVKQALVRLGVPMTHYYYVHGTTEQTGVKKHQRAGQFSQHINLLD